MNMGVFANSWTVLRNPMLFVLMLLLGGGFYVSYTLNLVGPMVQMTNAAGSQAVEIGKQRLRSFLENNETARQAIGMPGRQSSSSSESGFDMDRLDSRGKRLARPAEEYSDM